jgi:hypothetical protein
VHAYTYLHTKREEKQGIVFSVVVNSVETSMATAI